MKKILSAILLGTLIFGPCCDHYSFAAETESVDSDAVVVLKDGRKITKDDIKNEMDNIPAAITSKMTLDDLKRFIAWRLAYNMIMNDVVKKADIENKKEVALNIEKRIKTTEGMMLLDEEAKKLMTFDKLKKFYDETWDQYIKGTKEFSLVAITTSNKNLATTIKEKIKDEKSLEQFLENNKAAVKSREMQNQSEAMFPQEISQAVLKNGKNSVIGPFESNSIYMLFFVKDIRDAQKKEFTKEIAEKSKPGALRHFIQEYTKTLYDKYKVKIMDLSGKEVDPFKILTKEDLNDTKSKSFDASKVKDDEVVAKIGDKKITVKNVLDFLGIDSIGDQIMALAANFNIDPKFVMIHATKLVVDDEILFEEAKTKDFGEKKVVKQKLQNIREMELIHAYYKDNVKVNSDDIKKTFTKFIKAIPEEDKNDHEISTKIIFFSTQEDASNALKSIRSGNEKFNDVFKEKQKNGALDLGYVKKRGISPELWQLLKKNASGTCCDQIVQIDGANFGLQGMNYAIVYVADRRPVTLPTLSDPSVKKQFKMLAEREKAGKLAEKYLTRDIKTIDGKPVEELAKNQEYMEKVTSFLVGFVG